MTKPTPKIITRQLSGRAFPLIVASSVEERRAFAANFAQSRLETEGSGLLAFAAPVIIEAAASGSADDVPKFSMVAYTGGKMEVAGWDLPIVVELAGMVIAEAATPIRLQHNPNLGVGHSTKIEVKGGKLLASGLISRDTAAARDVANSAKKGFPWQASIGAKPLRVSYVEEGGSVKANGQAHEGPCYYIEQCKLGEISFVDLGADGDTTAVVAGKPAPGAKRQGEENMNKAKMVNRLIAAGWAKEEQRADLMAAADSVIEVMIANLDNVEAAATARSAQSQKQTSTAVEDIRAENLRCAGISRLCAGKDLTIKDGENEVALEAHAIANNWTVEQTELHVLRASRPSAPNVAIPAQAELAPAIECAIEQTLGLDVSKKSDQVQAAAARLTDNSGRIGIQRVLVEAAAAHGVTFRSVHKGNLRDVLAAAMPTAGIRAAGGFSSINIGGILGAAANKKLRQSFMSVEQVWRLICTIRNVSDFKAYTSYRLTADTQYKKVAPTGNIEHGSLGESSFSNKADTYGLMLALTRTDIVNDDLGAFLQLLNLLGRGAGLKLNDVFWTVFLANSNFFKSDNKNYASGAGTALSVDALTAAEQMFMDMVDEKGKPVGLNPAVLLVPSSLSAIAGQLYKGSEYRDNTASKQYSVFNPHQGKFAPAVSRYLNNTGYTGNSAKAWYLLANPADAATAEVAFLDGNESPTVETAEADFSTLGIQMRGYHDFGVALAEPKAGVKIKGEA